MVRAGRVRVVVVMVVLGLAAIGCGSGDASDGATDDGDSTATTSSGASSNAGTGATTVPPFEGLDPENFPDDLDTAFLDALQRCFVPETVGDEVFTFEGDPGDVAQLTPEMRPGFVALRDCMVDRAPESACVIAIEPLDAAQTDEEFAAVLAAFGVCASEELN
jgi:hypothetical protein